ncbi:aldo/keto reductase [Candidatus Latescibacterota bacterium]
MPVQLSRRNFIRTSATASLGLLSAPYLSFGQIGVESQMKNDFSRLNFSVTSMGLGGQASVQWTPPDLDAAEIIVKAYNLGINYFDTSNVYGLSAVNFGRAFRQLNLVPGLPGYDESRRRSIWLTTKSAIRWAKNIEGLGRSNGPGDSAVVDDLKRTLILVFGDGEGYYPPGAYIDMILAHSVGSIDDVDALYTGLLNPDPRDEQIGAYAALLDYRDGTNYTGLNPKEERLVRHIGFSTHDAGVGMELIQRDERNIIDAVLLPINANDFNYFNMQNNLIPVAKAKNMGVVGMKVFSRANFYLENADAARSPETMYRPIGSDAMPSRPLVEYAVSTPGMNTTIIGIGHIDDDPQRCQLTQNLSAAQVAPSSLSTTDRRTIEQMASRIKGGMTNYYMNEDRGMSEPREAAATQEMRGSQRIVRITWQGAYAGLDPLAEYEIWRGPELVGRVAHTPQITKAPFVFEDSVNDRDYHRYRIVAVDSTGQRLPSGDIAVRAMV